jgi:hypothetical protein
MSPATTWARSPGHLASLPEFGCIDANEPDAIAAKLQGIAIYGPRLAGKGLSGPGVQIDIRRNHCGEQSEHRQP